MEMFAKSLQSQRRRSSICNCQIRLMNCCERILPLLSLCPTFHQLCKYMEESRHFLPPTETFLFGSKRGLQKIIVNTFQTWENICTSNEQWNPFSPFKEASRLIPNLKNLQHSVASFIWFLKEKKLFRGCKQSFCCLPFARNFFTFFCNTKNWINLILKDFCKHFWKMQVTG